MLVWLVQMSTCFLKEEEEEEKKKKRRRRKNKAHQEMTIEFGKKHCQTRYQDS